MPPPTHGAPRLIANRFVFFSSALMVFGGVALAGSMTRRATNLFQELLSRITLHFGWLYVLSVGCFGAFCLYLATSRHGHVRLGKDGETPEFSTGSWFAMLFSAGMGIGLLFFSVAEPMTHFVTPPDAAPGSVQAARDAMLITFFHWGLHAWAVYVAVGVSLAYFSFRHGLPLSMRSCLHPLIGERLRGRAGDCVDLLAVFATVFGLATSLGLGAMQINAGLSHVFGLASGATSQVVIIGVITLCATASVVTGIDAGIRRLSELNVILATLLASFVLLVGPTQFLLDAFVDNLGYYLQSVVARTFLRDAYRDADWYADWTIFYWAWWIAWSPFVGTFVARISRGRTIREFVLGALLVPTLVTFVWLTIFGNTALHLQMFEGKGIADAVTRDTSTAIFVMLEQLPLASVTAPLAVLLVGLFFVTSSDSGSLVVDMLTSGGDPDPPVWQRIFWALTEGVVAAVLLVMGGLKALQSATIVAGLPLVGVLVLMCYGLLRALRAESDADAASADSR